VIGQSALDVAHVLPVACRCRGGQCCLRAGGGGRDDGIAAAPRDRRSVAGVRFGATWWMSRSGSMSISSGLGFGSELDGAFCGGAVRGEASFRFRSGVARLWRLAFTGGVHNQRGFGRARPSRRSSGSTGDG